MKALRFYGIALLACGMMFVSCKKDNPKPADNTTSTKGVNISFNGSSWKAADMVGMDYSADGYLLLIIEKTANCGVNAIMDETNPSNPTDKCLAGYMESSVGEWTYESSQGDVMDYYDPSYTYTDENGVMGQAGKVYYGWNVVKNTFTEKITAIDLNKLTMSATFSEEIFDMADLVAMGGLQDGYLPNDISTKLLTGTMDEASWAWIPENTKKMGKKQINNTISFKKL